MRWRLCLVFFLSGAGALVFENLWFRQAGLAFGNGVWASSLVLASFMGGLALGNALAARTGERLSRPVRVYAGLEVAVALTGVLLVLGLPAVGRVVAPLSAGLVDDERLAALNVLRLVVSFVLLVVPATAMGLTLPLLARALSRGGTGFGENLGALYGWNTLGGVSGAVAVETLLVGRLGVRGTAVAAAALGLSAALLATSVSRAFETTPQASSDETARVPLTGEARRLLAAAFLTGGALLALEVVWFRFLSMFSVGSSLTFALQLAVVLAGIGLGALAASLWLRRAPGAHVGLGGLLALSGLSVVATYAGFYGVLPRLGGIYFIEPFSILAMAAVLALPTAFLSGVVFTLLGVALHERLDAPARATGTLTLANTVGALVGAIAGGFVLLPGLGMERSFAVVAGVYGAAILVLPKGVRMPGSGMGRRLSQAMVGLFAFSFVLFPYGLMAALYVRTPLLKYQEPSAYVLAVREGLTETAVYLEHRDLGEPLFRRLVTNGFSMSSTRWDARRYMGLYVQLPVAMHPGLRRALLVSFGVGSTARSLVHTKELERIDVVDISRDVLDLASELAPSPAEDPLLDPRVHAHVEDGRAFLQAVERTYDLVTSEPPPPWNAGVVNLYSKEYFELLYRHLEPGGFVTYWLPLHALGETGARAVVRSFCDVFSDCTAWCGTDLDWMLVGTRGARTPVGGERVAAQWDDPRVRADLLAGGLDRPELLGALYLAGAAELRTLVGATPPVTDDRPNRLAPGEPAVARSFLALMEARAARAAFARSDFVAAIWPEDYRSSASSAFDTQEALYERLRAGYEQRPPSLDALHRVVSTSHDRLPVLLFLGSDPDRDRIVTAPTSDVASARAQLLLGVSALADHDPARAAEHARAALERGAGREATFVLAYALCLQGRAGEAAPLLGGLDEPARAFLARKFPGVIELGGAAPHPPDPPLASRE